MNAATTMILFWKLLKGKLRAFRSVTILERAMEKMMGHLSTSFLFLMIVLFLGFGTAKYLLPQNSAKRNYFKAIYGLFQSAISGSIEENQNEHFFEYIIDSAFAVIGLVRCNDSSCRWLRSNIFLLSFNRLFSSC